MVNIYLGNKDRQYEAYVSWGVNATIKVKKELYNKSKNFEIVKYKEHGYLVDEKDLSEKLYEEWKKISSCVIFYTNSGSSDVKQISGKNEVHVHKESERKFYRISFFSSKTGTNAKLYTDKWFPKNKDNVYIPEITSGSGCEYDGIIVYYSFSDDDPLLIECVKGPSEKTQYLRKDKDGFYWMKQLECYSDEKLLQQFDILKAQCQENITFLLHKNISYGYSVQVSEETKNSQDLIYNHTIYKHIPTDPKSSFALYYNSLFPIKDAPQDVQNKKNTHIEVYALDLSKELHLLVKFTENETPGTGSKEKYYSRNNKEGKEWENKVIPEEYSKNLGIILYGIYYTFSKSIIIQLEQRSNTQYSCKVVDNNSSDTGRPLDNENLKISVNEVSECIKENKYKCYVHTIQKLDEDLKSYDIAGLRLYNTQEIKLYKKNSVTENDREYLHYVPGMSTANKLYVYFDASDHKLLLVCYDSKAYKAIFKDDREKLVLETDFDQCDCTANKNIDEKLYDIKNKLESEQDTIPSNTSTVSNSDEGHSEPGFWEKNKTYILAGVGAGLVGIIAIIVGVVLYKKCVKVNAPVGSVTVT
ncbi:hypothetical protein MACJ_002484 [Theileria orientalis]|uniref:Uncharacterized protein n=1 Tax=Theileria orientalis TaxID=68886 RepID=A0A976M6C6_THEOR|nr:hypothetical protein MACJ_002484 [Theileria orientalis]